MAKKNTKFPAQEPVEASKAPEGTADESENEEEEAGDEPHQIPRPPQQELFHIRGVPYDLLERLPGGVLHLRFNHATDGPKLFFYNPTLAKKVARNTAGVFVPAKGTIPGQPRAPRGASASSADDEDVSVELTPAANAILKDFLALSGEDDRGEVTSSLLVEHLGKEVERLRAGASLVKKFGPELANTLAGYSKEDLQKLLASARKG